VHESAATIPAAPAVLADPLEEAPAQRWALIAALLGLTAAAAAIRFLPLGVQSFHHDEVITVMRVIPGSFGQMLHEVKSSESNPPLYYVLAWGWAQEFGRSEWGIRSLSALLGTLTVPVGYAIGRQLSGRRVGLVLMAIWPSARC
jgi:predicted membrane-bound mannosyltransferase